MNPLAVTGKLRTSAAILIGLALFVFSAGCGKKSSGGVSGNSPAPTAGKADIATEDNAASAAAPRRSPPVATEAAATPATSENEPLVGMVHDFMTAQLRKFIAENGRLPNTFSEFAQSKMDTVPRAPAGLKFAIDETTQEVKLVKK